MGAYILRRCLTAPLVLLILITLSFFLVRMTPGDPFAREQGVDASVQAALNEKFHFDKPLIVQYGYYLGNVVCGDLGPSTKYKNRPVLDHILANIGVSLQLGSLALFFALLMGIGFGALSAVKQNSWIDYSLMSFSLLGLSIPIFVVGPILLLTIAPIINQNVYNSDDLFSLLVPALTLSLPFTARIARLARAGMLEIIHQDFVRTARAKGLSEWRIMSVHVLRGALIPVIGYLGPAIAAILTGSLVVEQIFQIPGLGRDFVESALNRDYNMVLGTVIIYGALVIFCNLISDILYGVLDPRVRYEQR